MDIEKLKLILEALKGAGQEAASFAYLWLAQGFIADLMVMGAIYFLIHQAAKLIGSAINGGKFHSDLRTALGTGYGSLEPKEMREIVQIVSDSKNK